MKTFLEFYTSGFGPWLGITIGLYLLGGGLWRLGNRWIRSRNIARHGWPTNPLMDADGDIIHPPVSPAQPAPAGTKPAWTGSPR